MKKIFILSSMFFISLHAQENAEQPTIEQIINAKEVGITIKCSIKDDNYDKQLWKEITLTINDLINKCYASDSDQFTTEEIFEEIHNAIDCMQSRTDADNGIYGLVEVHVGQPPLIEDSLDQKS